MTKLAKAEKLAPHGKMHRVWTPRRGQAKCRPTFSIAFGLVLVCGFFYPFAALAQVIANPCLGATASNMTIICSGTFNSGGGTTGPPAMTPTSGSLVIPAVGAGQSTNGSMITIENDAMLTGTDRTTTSIGNGNTLNIGDPPTIGNTGGATLTTTSNTNDANVGTLYLNLGPNTVEAGANNTINISAGSTITAQGTNGRSEAINLVGFGNTITNNGTIFSNTSSAIFLQNNPALITQTPMISGGGAPGSGGNVDGLGKPGVQGSFSTVIDNFGTITSLPGPNALPGTSGEAIAETPQPDPTAPNANKNVLFVNEEGATVNGNVTLGNGNDTVELFSGSTINGNLSGAPNPYPGNLSNLVLNAETEPGTLNGSLTNFDTLVKTGPFGWVITGPLVTTRGNGLTSTVEQGTLILTGANPSYNGTMTVQDGGTLQIGNGGTDGTFEHDIITESGGIVAFDRSDALTYSNQIIGGGGVDQIGEGTTTFGSAQSYTGPTTVAAGTLAAGGEDFFSANSATTVNHGATLALESFDQTINNVTNNGTIQFPAMLAESEPGTTLTVANYSGTGILAINTFLGSDSSPSDKLVVNGGMATGSTSIDVHNVGGPGEQTTGNGILVVQAQSGATTGSEAARTFFLDNPVFAGAFEYNLVQIGQDWFLQNGFEPGEPEEPGEEPGEPPDVPLVPPGEQFPVHPPPEPLPEEVNIPGVGEREVVFPDIGPQLATYGVVVPIAREMGLMTLGTREQRIGDTAPNACPPGGGLITKAPVATTSGCCPAATATSDGGLITKAPPPVTDCRPAVWGRFFGQQVNNQYEAFADPRATGWMGGFQGGLDLYRGSLWGGTDVAGIYFSYGDSTIDVSGLVTNTPATAYILEHTGHLGLNAFSAGGYWTHYGPTGWYLDAVLQGTLYEGTASTNVSSLPIRGSGFVSSLESGYPFPLPVFGPGFVLEPQAQIIYQQVAFDNANDRLEEIGLGTNPGVTGRLGVRGKWAILDDNGELWQPYVGVNVWRDWVAQATTAFGVDQVPLNQQATRLEFNGGLTTRINNHLSVYGQAGYQFAVSQTSFIRRNAVQADVGVHYAW